MACYRLVLFVALGIFITLSLAGVAKKSKNSMNSMNSMDTMDTGSCTGSGCKDKTSSTCLTDNEWYIFLFGPTSLTAKITVAERLKNQVDDPRGKGKDEVEKLDKYIKAMREYLLAEEQGKDENTLEHLKKNMETAQIDLQRWRQRAMTLGTRAGIGLAALTCIHFAAKGIKKAKWSPKWAKNAVFWVADEPEVKAPNSTKLPPIIAPATEPPFFSPKKILWSIIIICVVLLGVAVYMFRDQLGFGGDEEEEDSKSKPKEGLKAKSGQEGGKVSSPDEKITTTPSSKVSTTPGSKIAATPVDSKVLAASN